MDMQMIFKTLALGEVTENVRLKKEDIRSKKGSSEQLWIPCLC